MTDTLVRPDTHPDTSRAVAPLSAFVGDAGQQVLALEHGRCGYVPVGRWAVMPCDPVSETGSVEETVAETLSQLRDARLRPVVVASEHPDLWARHGMHLTRIADDARIEVGAFTLAGKQMSKLRHAVTSAERAGLRIEPYSPSHAADVEKVSRTWLATKRGGELRLTLGRLSDHELDGSTSRLAVNADDQVVAFVTWRRYGDDARVLDLMRRLPDAPNPAMDALLAHSLLEMRDQWVTEASLNAVPLSRGPLGEHIFPTRSLRAYKEKFAPHWAPQWLVTPSRARHLSALLAVVHAYCPAGITHALRRNPVDE